MILFFTVDKQIITRRDNEKVVRDSQNYLYINFSFSEDWTGTKTAVFKGKSGNAFNVLIDENGSCLVPWEVLTEEYFEVSAFCGDLITANVVKVFTIESGYAIGEESRTPTPDIYAQIIARLSAIEAEIDPTAIQQVVDEYLSDKGYVTEQDVEQIVADYIEAHKDELKGDTGATGPQGPQGIQGPKGDTGEGVAAGGTTGQVLIKSSDANYDTEWGNLGTIPIMPNATVQGAYYYKSGSGSTVTRKSDGTVDFSNNSASYGAAFFELPVNEKCINKIKLSCTMLSGELTDGTIYINKVGTGLITLKANLSITGSEEYEVVLTPEFLAQKELTSPIYIALATWSNVSFNIGFSNTYGVEDSVLDLNLKVRARTLEGKKAIFLGDSITALTDNRSWVEKFLEITGCLKVANVAVSSARLYDYEDTVYDGDPKSSVQHNNTLGNQVQKIINNQYETPDLIIIAIGTNGGITADTTRITAVYYNNGSMPPLADIDKTHSEGAFRYCTETLHNLYPNATIFWCNPIQAAIDSREIGLINSYGDNLKILTQWGAVNNVETNRCGIMSANETGQHEYLVDGLHPNEAGALKMARYNSAVISALFT